MTTIQNIIQNIQTVENIRQKCRLARQNLKTKLDGRQAEPSIVCHWYMNYWAEPTDTSSHESYQTPISRVGRKKLTCRELKKRALEPVVIPRQDV